MCLFTFVGSILNYSHKRDFGYDYFGFKTLEKSYLPPIG